MILFQTAFILFNIFIICVCSIGFSNIFTKYFFKKKTSTYEKVIIGIFLTSFLGLIINFFYKISISLSYSLLIIGIILFFTFNQPKKYKTGILKILYICLLSLILILFSNLQEDYPWYSIPFISYISNEKISFGISNIQFRFGHISFLSYSSAIFGQIFTKNNIILPNVITSVAFLLYFLNYFLKSIKNENKNYSSAFAFFIISYSLLKFARFEEYGNDAPAQFLFYYLILKLLEIYQENKIINNLENIKIIFIFFVFMILQKITMLAAFPIIFILLFYIKNDVKYFYKIFFLCSTFVVLWCFKNLINTGCLLYPIDITCFNNLDWTANTGFHGNAKQVSEASEAWSKAWVDQKETSLNYRDYIDSFLWIKTWIKSHFFVIINKVAPLLFLIIILLLILTKNKNKNKKNTKSLLILLICLFFSILIWFLKYPIFRYGSSFIITFIVIIFIIIFQNFSIKKNYKKLKILIIICFAFFIQKNLLRILNADKSYRYSPWPKIYSGKNNLNKKYNVLKSGKTIILSAKDNKACYYSISICTHHVEIINDITIKMNQFGYIFYVNN